MKQKIAIKKLNGLLVRSGTKTTGNKQLASTFTASLMSYGYVPSKDLFDALSTLDSKELATLHKEAIEIISTMKGANVKHKPMYPNFPQQVMEASWVELYLNAVLHYWTFGHWKPSYEALPRELAFEKVEFKTLGLVSEAQVSGVFTTLLKSNDSLSDEDKSYIEWFIANVPDLTMPETIPFKETMCVVAGMLLKTGHAIPFVKTATDILRIITYMNGGDISLAENTKFKSMPRLQRKMFAEILDRVATEEDINRHRNKWTKLFHSLHIGDYSTRLYEIAKKIRNNERIETFNSRVESAISSTELAPTLALLSKRPGDFARRLDHLLRTFDQKKVTSAFLGIAPELATRTITQVLGHLNTRRVATPRVAFPKGSTQRAIMLPAHAEPLSPTLIYDVSTGLEETLKARFSKLEPLGKVWIDPALYECPIPSQQRSASEGLFNVARGTRLPIGDKGTLRFFVYWVGQDIDLSASLHDANFNYIEHIGYTNLRNHAYESCHSGDITNAPTGASEFIDITIDPAVRFGARYVVMNVFVFRGPTFKGHETCFAGWMTRSQPKSNEIYDPKTVAGKIDIRAESKNSIPVVFDLVERKAIWADLSTKARYWPSGTSYSQTFRRRGRFTGNNVESNKATIEQTLKSIVEARAKLSLYELFRLHGEARGQLVESKEEADTIFSLSEGITPFDINKISSDYLA